MRADGDQHDDACTMPSDDTMRAACAAERRRLARDLHDSVTQTLIGLQWTTQAVADLWDSQPAQARVALETVCQLATAATTELRAVLLDLHDAVLERQGLLPALQAYGAVVRQRSGLQVELHVETAESGSSEHVEGHGADARLPWAQEETLYYVAREALNNVVKHARASRATVRLWWDATVACLVVEDDGVGFGLAAEPAAFTYGLVGMRERVEALGGRLLLENRPTGGARVVAELPLCARRRT